MMVGEINECTDGWVDRVGGQVVMVKSRFLETLPGPIVIAEIVLCHDEFICGWMECGSGLIIVHVSSYHTRNYRVEKARSDWYRALVAQER